MKGFYCLEPETNRKKKGLKRSEKKSLPQIYHKEVPLHNNSCQKTYKKPIVSGLSLDRWAYVWQSKKKDMIMTKYIHEFDQFRTHPSICLNPENEVSLGSLTLLDKYFKRKKMSRLKQIIKIPVHSTEEGVNSLGLEGINSKIKRDRQTIQYYCNPQGADTEAFHTPEKRNCRKERFRVHRNKSKEEGLEHTVDFYFTEKTDDEFSQKIV